MPDAQQEDKQAETTDNTKRQTEGQESGRKWFTEKTDAVVEEFDTDPQKGLSEDEAKNRLEQYGPNQLAEEKPEPVWKLLLSQFKTMVVYILGAGMVLAFSTGRWPEGWALLAVIVVNAAIGFVSEWRARKSMAALRAMSKPTAKVSRDGEEQEIKLEEVVPGDILIIEPEDIMPADGRLLETESLRVSEAALTGESVAVNKTTRPQDSEAPLAERTNMIFKGTTAEEGRGKAVITATGNNTELGKINKLASGQEDTEAPLQKRLDQLGARLAYISLGLAVLIGIIGLISGRDMVSMVETALALGVAMIPEGLPIVATIALARGMWLMAQRQALINRLTAVQTLGSTQVICTDKTGTLTYNHMVTRKVVTAKNIFELRQEDDDDDTTGKFEPAGDNQEEPDEELLAHAIDLGMLCNNAEPKAEDEEDDEERKEEGTSFRGDPTEVALLQAGRMRGLTRKKLLEDRPEVNEHSFDPDVMMMATVHEQKDGEKLLMAVKGAPGRVLEACTTIATGKNDQQDLTDEEREKWEKHEHKLAGQGLRLLAVADKQVDTKDAEPYENLRFVGYLGLNDPPREDVRDSIEKCREAGIRVVMVTGDQKDTARAIGRETGIIAEDDDDEASQAHEGRELEELDDSKAEELSHVTVFSRVSPEQKLNLVKLLQDRDYTVAMTGDGVNDAPALKKADIGIAMGQRGTDAAKQVSDMILKNDDFSTILKAVEQGRVIFGNIRKSVIFMLCTNLSEIIAVGVAAALNTPLPLLPLQILYLNVLTDVFPALALGVGKGHRDVLDRPPRPSDEGLLTKKIWAQISGWGFVISACVLFGLYYSLKGLGLEEPAAITVSFLTLGFAKLFFPFNLRDQDSGFFKNDITSNPWMWGAWALCIALLLAAVYLPGLSDILQTQDPGAAGWGLILGLALIPAVIGQIWIAVKKHMGNKPKG